MNCFSKSSLIYRLVRSKKLTTTFVSRIRSFHHEFSNETLTMENKLKNKKDIPGAIQSKYKIYRDEDSPEIFDVEEEKQRKDIQEISHLDPLDLNVDLKRGVTGVFDIEDLVEVLQKESAGNIFVCSVPKEFKYVDYMCVVTGRSYRHMIAMAEYVRRVYKKKRIDGDILPKIEGVKSEWIALDLGNIALHIFSEESRQVYDLESLWSVGPEFDREFNKPEDPLVTLLDPNSVYLHDLKPKENLDESSKYSTK